MVRTEHQIPPPKKKKKEKKKRKKYLEELRGINQFQGTQTAKQDAENEKRSEWHQIMREKAGDRLGRELCTNSDFV